MSKPAIIITNLGLASAFILLLLVGYWTMYPYKPIEFFTEPHKVLTKSNVAGSHVSFNLDYCKYMDLSTDLTVSFVDGFVYNTTPIITNLEIGCHSLTQSIYIPKALPAGTYSVKMAMRYKVNPIRYIDVVTQSDKFEVTK